MKKKIVIYARFSSHSQTEQSIEGQLRECYDYAKRNNYLVVGEYIDRALTGTTDKRPEFLQMIEDSKKKTFEYVLVYQLDRFARNRYDSANYKAKLKKNGIRVLSAKENITDDASGILVEGMLESMAEYYSAELSQKVKRGIRESLLKGNFIGGNILYGYDIVDKKWVINEFEADIVRNMFEQYKNGKKCKELINNLNNRGIKNKVGSKFTISSFSRMIRNSRYTGKVITEDEVYYDIVPAIIDEKLFNTCNKIMDGHKHMRREVKNNNPYLLSGKLYCGECGEVMTAETGTSKTGRIYHYYKCYNKKRRITKCTTANYSKDELESIVFDKTIEYVLQPNVIDQASKIVADKFNSELAKPGVLLSLEQTLKGIDRALQGLITALENGIVSKTTQTRLLQLENQKEEIEEKIACEKARELKPIDAKDVKKFITYFANKEYESDEEKNEFFNSFIHRVIVYDKKIVLLYNTSPDTNEEIKITSNDEIIEFLNGENIKNDSFKPCKFKRVARGGEREI